MYSLAILFLLFGLPAALTAWYCTETYVSSVSNYIVWIRIAIFGFITFYFNFVADHVKFVNSILSDLLSKYDKKGNGKLRQLFSLLPALCVIIIAGELTTFHNNSILLRYHEETTAVIIDCYRSKGTQYCEYVFFVNNRKYEDEFSNRFELPQGRHIKISYYPKNPQINTVLTK